MWRRSSRRTTVSRSSGRTSASEPRRSRPTRVLPTAARRGGLRSGGVARLSAGVLALADARADLADPAGAAGLAVERRRRPALTPPHPGEELEQRVERRMLR